MKESRWYISYKTITLLKGHSVRNSCGLKCVLLINNLKLLTEVTFSVCTSLVKGAVAQWHTKYYGCRSTSKCFNAVPLKARAP